MEKSVIFLNEAKNSKNKYSTKAALKGIIKAFNPLISQPETPMRVKNLYLLIPSLIAWVFLVGWGWSALSKYENTPGVEVSATSERWPTLSKIERSENQPTMVMFLHPKCPCSRASMAQLSKIMAHSQNKVSVKVVFIKPSAFASDWVKTDLYRSAASTPGVDVLIDEAAQEAEVFHVQTSGQVMLYDREGQLVFNGGITSARGHEGDNTGQDAIISFLTKGEIATKKTPFFGCLLTDKSEPGQLKEI